MLLVGFTLALGSASTLAMVEAASAQAADRDPAALEAVFFQRVNQLRAAQGLAPYAADGEIRSVAQGWTDKMADAGKISHNPDLARQVTAPWRKLGENVGTGGDAESVEDAFEASPGHRKNILDPEFTTMAITVVTRGERIYVTQQFRRGDPASTTVAPAVIGGAPNELALAVGSARPKSASSKSGRRSATKLATLKSPARR